MKPMKTRVALAGYGSIDVRGRSILSGEHHTHGFWSMFSIAVGHRELTKEESLAIDVLSNTTMIGDPRLWPFRATRIVAAYGDLYLATAAANGFNSRGKIGAPAIGKALAQMLELREAVGPDATVDDVKDYLAPKLERGERMAGYYVVARPTDERHDFVAPWLEERGWYEGEYLAQTRKIDEAMWSLKEIRPNIAALWGGLLLDFGFTPVQGAQLALTGWQWSVHGNIVEVVESEEYEALKRLPDEYVQWCGEDDRTSPRASS